MASDDPTISHCIACGTTVPRPLDTVFTTHCVACFGRVQRCDKPDLAQATLAVYLWAQAAVPDDQDKFDTMRDYQLQVDRTQITAAEREHCPGCLTFAPTPHEKVPAHKCKLTCCKYEQHCCIPMHPNTSECIHCTIFTCESGCWSRIGVCDSCERIDCIAAISSKRGNHTACDGTWTDILQRVEDNGTINNRRRRDTSTVYQHQFRTSMVPRIQEKDLLAAQR